MSNLKQTKFEIKTKTKMQSNIQKCFSVHKKTSRGKLKEYIYNDTNTEHMWKLVFNENGDPWFYELLERHPVECGIQCLYHLKHTYFQN